MTFATAIKNTSFEARTENGMKALQNSTNALVDLFYAIGASRGKNITAQFERAFQEDPIIATKIALWARDVRGGAGERKIFRDILGYMEEFHPSMLEKLLPYVAEYGRYDDLLIFTTEKFKHQAYGLIKEALDSGNQLCAKWLPREKSSNRAIAIELQKFLKLSPKQYRKLLVNTTNVVETKMCAKLWNDIEFGKLPSVASARYQKAFSRNATDAYQAYKVGLQNGTEKINAGAVYPYDVIKSLKAGDKQVALAQWEALPNFMTDANVLPMVDVSGSMMCPVGGNANLHCLDVAVSLGLYCADKNTGAFKDCFLTFSTNTDLQVLKGNLIEKYNQLMRSEWGMSTDLHKAFDAVLKVAVDNKVPESDMPRYILILSDMQFNQCCHFDDSAYEMIQRKYEAAGYNCPAIVFWNLRDGGNVPVRFDQTGTCLVSGFSPAIMKSILSAQDMNAFSIMMQTIGSDRYNIQL